MVKSRRHRSRKRSRKRRGSGAEVSLFGSNDLALGKGVAAMVKKGAVAEGIALKQCNLITNQFKKKICTEKVAKAQRKRAALAKKGLKTANAANAAANKKLGLVQKRIAAIEKKTKAAAAAGGGKRKRRRTKRRRKRRKSKKSRRKSRKTKRRRKSKKRRSRRRRR